MHHVLDWLKSNIPIIIFAVVILASVLTLPLIAGRMNESVREEIQARARGLSDLQRIENTSIPIPDTNEQVTGVVNERLIEQYREYFDQRVGDATTVREAALQHNRKNHTILMPELFPEPPREYREVYPRHFHERLVNAYSDLLEDVRVGMPPSESTIARELERREQQFRVQVLRRDTDESLASEERAQLEEELRSLRMLRYQEQAQTLLYYLDPEALRIPEFDRGTSYSLNELFEWQWRFWIHSDMLRALATANEADGSVISGPLKRVAGMSITESPAMRGGGASPQPYNPAREVTTDFSVSLTGRRSNHMYDVRNVDLSLIVDSNRIYDVIDAISSYNFVTVLSAEVSSTSAYDAARAGFYYGTDPVVRLTLQVETIWFREWTSERMPEATLSALGIQVTRDREGT